LATREAGRLALGITIALVIAGGVAWSLNGALAPAVAR
jgi:hypothetical protein